jgi:hypothetical protein
MKDLRIKGRQEQEQRDIHSTPVTCNRYWWRTDANAAVLARVRYTYVVEEKLEGFRSPTMANDSHQRAAEFHMQAAHAHQAAAASHGKEDHLTGHEHSRQAMEFASKAFEASKQAHEESWVDFKKQEKKS